MSNHNSDNDDYISITLSPVQVEQVMRAASKSPSGTVSNLLLAALDNAHDPPTGSHRRAYDLQRASQEALTAALDDPQLSQSLLRGLSVLACYGPGPALAPDHRAGEPARHVALDDASLCQDAQDDRADGAGPNDAGVPSGRARRLSRGVTRVRLGWR